MNTSSSATRAITARSIANVIAPRARLVSAWRLASFGVVAVSLMAPRSFAAPPPVTVAQPVQVQVVNTEDLPAKVKVVGPVQMEGVVETLDEVHRTPFNKTVSAIDPSAKIVYLQFPIPTGKRLVIKSIGLACAVAAGNFVYANLTEKSSEIQLGDYFMPLVFQSSIVSGFAVFHTATISTDIMFDRREGFTPTIQLNIPASPGLTPSLTATISGYLVDL